jgi:hypothetical protein
MQNELTTNSQLSCRQPGESVFGLVDCQIVRWVDPLDPMEKWWLSINNQWIGLRENLNRKPLFSIVFTIKYRVSG